MNYFNLYDEDGIYATIKTTLTYSVLQTTIQQYKYYEEDCYTVEGLIEYIKDNGGEIELIIAKKIYF